MVSAAQQRAQDRASGATVYNSSTGTTQPRSTWGGSTTPTAPTAPTAPTSPVPVANPTSTTLPAWFASQEQYSTYYNKQSTADKAKLVAAWYWAPTTPAPQWAVKPKENAPVAPTTPSDNWAPAGSDTTPTPAATTTTPKVTKFTSDSGKTYDITDNAGKFSFISKDWSGRTRTYGSLEEAQNAIVEGNRNQTQVDIDKVMTRLNSLNVKTWNALANISWADAAFLMNNNTEKYNEYLNAVRAQQALATINWEVIEWTPLVDTDIKTWFEKLLADWGISLNNVEVTDLSAAYQEAVTTEVQPLLDSMNEAKVEVDSYKRDYEWTLRDARKQFEWSWATDSFIRAYAAKKQEEQLPEYQNAIDNYNNSVAAYQAQVWLVDKKFDLEYKDQALALQAQSQQIQNFSTMYGLYQETPEWIAETYAAQNPSMDTGTLAQKTMGLNQALDWYYKDFGYMIQRSQAQVASDVKKLAASEWISRSAALKKNFLDPLKAKDEYKTFLVQKTGKWEITKLSETTWLERNADGSRTFKSSWGSSSSPTQNRADQIQTIKDAMATAPNAAAGVAQLADWTDGWQCWYFSNNINMAQWWQKLFGDSLASKMNMIAQWEWAKAGNYIVMDTWAKLPDWTPAWHVGYIISVNGDWTVTVKDSNWNGDGKIMTHTVSLTDKTIKWYVNPAKNTKNISWPEDNWPSQATATLDEIISYNDDVTRRKMSPEDVKRIGEAKKAVMSNKNSSIEAILAWSNGWKAIWETQSKVLIKFDQALTQLGTVQNQIKNMNTWPIIGALRKLNPYDTDAQVLKAAIQGLVPTIARGIYGEVGVLTDNDVRLYAKTLPTLTWTDEINKWVLAVTLDVLAGGYLTQLKSLAGQGYDVSGMQWVYDNIKGQADLLRQGLWMGVNGTEDDDIFN